MYVAYEKLQSATRDSGGKIEIVNYCAANLYQFIIIIIRTRDRRWIVAFSTFHDHQPLSRPPEQSNVSLSERHITSCIVVFLAFFSSQDLVWCRQAIQQMH